jgi:Fe-Mn family superoxide dismutase
LATHHGFHHAAYVERTRVLTRGTPLESAPLEEVVRASVSLDSALFKAAAQAWNHTFYWNCVRPGGGGAARGAIAGLIEQSFGTENKFRQQFVGAAADQFGSGWAWLVLDAGQLRITATSNADTPLTTSAAPLLTLDMWEHAYYLDYQHRRLDYIAAFLAHLVNWDFVNQALSESQPHSLENSAA